MASSLFILRAWQSSRTTSLQVLFGLPLGLGPSNSYSIHFFTKSSSSFRSTCPYQRSLSAAIPMLCQKIKDQTKIGQCKENVTKSFTEFQKEKKTSYCSRVVNANILVTWFGTNCNAMATSSTGHVALLRPSVFRNVIALDTRQEVGAIVATCCNHINSPTTHTHLTALCPGLPGWAGTRKVKPIWTLLKQETVSGSGIIWAICKSAPRSRQITTCICPSCHPTNSDKALKTPHQQPHTHMHTATPEHLNPFPPEDA